MTAVTDNRTRAAPAAVAAAVLAVLVAACSGGGPEAGGGGPPSAGGSSRSPSAVAYSSCMRTHGVPKFPDPASNGQVPKGDAQHFEVSTSRYQAAEQACQNQLPNTGGALSANSLNQCLQFGGGACPHALVQRALTEGRPFAQCMRHHGVPDWPDPTVDAIGRPSYQVTKAGVSIAGTRSGPIASKIGHCETQTGSPLLRQE